MKEQKKHRKLIDLDAGTKKRLTIMAAKEKDSPSLKRFIELKLETIANNYKPTKRNQNGQINY